MDIVVLRNNMRMRIKLSKHIYFGARLILILKFIPLVLIEFGKEDDVNNFFEYLIDDAMWDDIGDYFATNKYYRELRRKEKHNAKGKKK